MTLAQDIAGHFAYVALIVGMMLLARRRRSGFLVRVAGEITWTVIGWQIGSSSIVIWSVVFVAVEAYGWRRWGHP